jgi:competence protein ComEC
MGRTGHGFTMLAAAIAIGVAAGDQFENFLIARRWIVWALAAAMLVAGFMLTSNAKNRRRTAFALMFSAMTLAAAAWYVTRQHFTTPDDLAAMIGDEQAYMHARGIAEGSPQLRSRFGGMMARFDYRQPSTYFPMRVISLVDRNGNAHAVHGRVLVRVDETVAPFRAGDHLEVKGFLLRPAPPRNPGEFDYAAYAKSLGQAGILSVAQRDLLVASKAERASAYEYFLRWRDELRRRASAWLLSELPESARSERDSLLKIFLLGERDEQIDGVQSAFERVGLAHLLAISGFHLAVLAGFVLLLLRAGGGHQRWHGWVVIAFVLLYLLLVEARMPVLRAGVMTIIASLGLIASRRFHVGGLCALSAMALLLWRPDQLFNAGFQLTFGVVFALIYLSPHTRVRRFGRINREAATAGAMLQQWLRTGLNVSVVSWLIALPIVMHHFGVISVLGILMSVITVPLASIILALGFLKIASAAILPSVGLIIGVPLSIFADVLVAMVMTVDTLPWSHVNSPSPGAFLTLIALALACWWMRGDDWLRNVIARAGSRNDAGLRRLPAKRFTGIRVARWSASVAAVLWLFWPMPLNASLRIDMLSVGDGSCYIIRDARSTVIFDAGSSTDLNVARRSLIPAMRQLGVGTIDAIIISHADLDHYSAVAELAAQFRVREVIVSPQFLEESRFAPDGPAAFAMQLLNEQRVLISTISAGESRTFGDIEWKWIHPPPLREYRRGNDASMVIGIEAAGRRVLLTGDIQKEAMQQLLKGRAEEMRADVIELPHHGSFNARVQPRVVMQSTGWSRWQRDRWADVLKDVDRLVTARDGACSVAVMSDGTIRTSTFLKRGED